MDDLSNSFQNDITDSFPKAIAQRIMNNLFDQKASGQFCDVQFLHGSASVWAHSCVLASHSPYLMRLFQKYAEEDMTWSFNKPIQVNISSVTKCNGSSKNNCMDCTCKIIDFIYTGKIKLDPEHLDHVVNLSNNLEIDVLLLICQRYMRDHFKLLDSLPKANQISTRISCDDIVDVKAYVDNLNSSVVSLNTLNDVDDPQSDSDMVDLSQSSTDKPSNSSSPSSTVKPSNSLNPISTAKTRNSLNPSSTAKPRNSLNSSSTAKPRNSSNLSPTVKQKKSRRYACSYCNFKSSVEDEYQLHKKVFHRRDYICLGCNYQCYKIGELLEHVKDRLHSGNMCSVCLFEAETTSELLTHYRDHERRLPFLCAVCNVNFRFRNDWVRHFYSHNHAKLQESPEKVDINPPVADKLKQISLSNSDAEEKQPKNYTCRICKYEYRNEDLLKKHSHVFHKRKYICLSCDFNSFKLESIMEHLIRTAHDEKVCSICLFVGFDRANLESHLLDHMNAQPFACSVCGNRFQTRNEWWRHELAHGTVKPFHCQYCDQSFQTSSYLKTHIVYRHREKRHVCKICGYTAPFASKLEKHLEGHKNRYMYKCKIDDCKYECTSKAELKKHRKEHLLPRMNVSCPVCSLKFKFRKNMKRHLSLTHNTINIVLKCPGCEYSSNRIDKMKEHCKNVHQDDTKIIEEINKQYNGFKTYFVPETVKKPRCSVTSKEKSDLNKEVEKTNIELQEHNEEEPGEKCENNFVNGNCNDSSKQTVLLSEATGEINIMCGDEGEPIPVASVTSTNMLTIGNFREGTGTVTLNETTGVLTFNNINIDSKGAVFLNESTGVLSYINLNMETPSEQEQECEQIRSEQVQLDEVTGEITKVQNNHTTNRNNNIIPEEDIPFDSFGFDFNEDSYDGFDEFDNLFFDSYSPIDSSQTNVDELLKNNAEELFGEDTPLLDEMTGELIFNQNSMESECNSTNIWSSVNTFHQNSIMESVNTEAYETLLNEVTGEFS